MISQRVLRVNNVGHDHSQLPDGEFYSNCKACMIYQAMCEIVEAAEAIANHKQGSVDKVYLLQQCDGYQECARKALSELEQALKDVGV